MAKQQPGKPQPGKPQPGKPSSGKAAGGKGKAGSKSAGGTAGYVMGWLGRQVGHVKKAVKTDVAQGKGAAPKSGAAPKPARAAPVPEDASDDSGSTTKIIYREDKIEEAEMPDRPGVILRRTIIDEVVVETEEQQHPRTERTERPS